MLVLSRKHGESVRIGDEVTVTVLQIKGETVRLGIDAPRGTPILREELYQAVARANINASAAQLDDLLKMLNNSK